jgi:hypothetical protein
MPNKKIFPGCKEIWSQGDFITSFKAIITIFKQFIPEKTDCKIGKRNGRNGEGERGRIDNEPVLSTCLKLSEYSSKRGKECIPRNF